MSDDSSCQARDIGKYLFLLHKFCIGTVINNVAAEDRCSQGGVDLLCANILQFAVKNKVVALRPKKNGCLLAKKNEGKDVAVLPRITMISIESGIPMAIVALLKCAKHTFSRQEKKKL